MPFIDTFLEENDGTLDPSAVVSNGRSANNIVRQLIFEATKDGTNISHVYRETLRAIIDLFNGFSVIDGEDKVKKIKAIYGNPERPIAKQIQEDNLILPIISVSQPTTSDNPDRLKYFPMVVEEAIWDERKQRATRIVSLAPRPIDIEYKITIWSKFKADLDQISEQIYLTFNPGWELQTNISNNTKVYLMGESDMSSVETADREDRLLRRMFTLEVQTYVPSPKFLFTSTGKIERLNIDAILS